MEHLTTIKLRNEHKVYKTDTGEFIIESPNRSNPTETYKTELKDDTIQIFLKLFRGKKMSIDEALQTIEESGYSKYLNMKGWKQEYEVEKILLCLVAAGYGRVEKKGKRHIFYF